MADLMADLLALAGDDDDASDEQNDTNQRSASQSPAPAVQAGPSISNNTDDPRTRSPAIEKKHDTPTKSPDTKKRSLASGEDGERARKKSKKEDSEEEGEASPAASSPSTLRSASMSESDSGTDPIASKANLSKFRVDGRFMSEEEKARIMSLPEIEREELLAERATAVEREKQNRMLMQILKEKERKRTDEAESPDRKRKSGAADLDEQQRKSTRQKTAVGGRKVGEASAPLEAYKRQREQRGAHAEQKQKEDQLAKDRVRAKSQGHSDADADGESEVEWDGGRRSTAAKRPSPPTRSAEAPPELIDYNHVRIGRTGFAKVCYYPGFDEAITGCYVRINIGAHPETGETVYRMAQIKRFTEGKPYAMEGPNGRNFITKQYALAAHGKAEREWPFIVCSDSNITEAEYQRYVKTCAVEGVQLPSKSFLVQKNLGIHALINRKWTEEELQEKLTRSGVLKNRMAPIIRAALRQDRAAAVARGDEAAIAKCDTELAALDGPKLAFGTKLHQEAPREKKEPTQAEMMAEVNRRNRKLNSIEIRRAEVAEWHQKHRRAMRKPNTAADGKSNGDDASGMSNGGSRAATPASQPGGTPAKVATPETEPIKAPVVKRKVLKTKEGFPMIGATDEYDEFVAALDMDVDIDIEI